MGSFNLENIQTKLCFSTKQSFLRKILLALLILMVASSVFFTAIAQLDPKGNLSVSISGLPTGVAANVVLGQLNGDYSHAIDASGTFSGLSAGDYLVIAVPVNVQGVSYAAANPVARRVTIGANTSQSIDVFYRQSDTTVAVVGPVNSTNPITPVTVLPPDGPSNPTLPSTTSTTATPVTVLPFPDSPPPQIIETPNNPQPTTTGGNSIISLNQGTSVLEGMVFHDKNRNGINEFNDGPIVDMQVFLDLNKNNVKDFDEPVAHTNIDGFYRFEGLANQNYTVMQNLPFGWSNTTAAQQNVGTVAGGQNLPEIVGGGFASYKDYPFIAALALKQDIIIGNNLYPKGQTWCGASLIAGDWIMTAAHCVHNANNSNEASLRITNQNLSVFMGGDEIYNRIVDPDKMTDVVKIIIHPDYNPVTLHNDIALLQLRNPIYFSRAILPNPSVVEEVYFPDTIGTVLGWGDTVANAVEDFNHVEVPSEFLKKAEVPIWRQRDCVLLPDYLGLTGQQFCAGYRQGLTDSCQGDSGGPLVVKVQEQWYQAGIVSTGFGCAQPNLPGIYTKVSEYLNWILQNTSSETSQNVEVIFPNSGGAARVDFGNFR